jgi:hypothetical protein
VTDDAVVCSPEELGRTPRETPAAEAAAARTMCVHVNVPHELAATLAPREPWSLPIVDDGTRFIGFVNGSMLAIHEAKPIRAALRIMARHGSRQIALVDDDGVLRGALSDIEALRALGRR